MLCSNVLAGQLERGFVGDMPGSPDLAVGMRLEQPITAPLFSNTCT